MRIGDKWISLNALHTFEVVGRLLHMGRAAKELNVTQSAVSHQIKALEISLGIQLFDRQQRRLFLTNDGFELLETVQKAFGDIASTGKRLVDSPFRQDLTIAVPPSFATQWMMPRLQSFLERFPSLTIRRVELPNSANKPHFDADLIVSFGQHAAVSPEDASVLVELEMFPVCIPKLSRGNLHVDSSILGNQTIIHEDDGTLWQAWLDQFSHPRIRPARQIHAGTNQDAKELARAGVGFALSDQLLGSQPLTQGALVKPFGSLKMTHGRYYIAYPHSEKTNPAAIEFGTWLQQEIAHALRRQ